MTTAPGWEKYGDWIERQQAPVVEWLCREAALRPGMTVVDVATGTGLPALTVARRIQPGGRILGTDVARDMLDGCERRARAAGLDAVELREADMHELNGVPDASADAVTLAFALMFSPEPARALRAVRRVLRPGARVVVSVWDAPAKNPFFTTMFGALRGVAPMPDPPPGAPGPFALAAPTTLEGAFRAAGFESLKIESVPFVFDFDSLDQHWEINAALAAPLKRAAEGLPPEGIQRLRAALADALAPYRDGERVRIQATALCASAER